MCVCFFYICLCRFSVYTCFNKNNERKNQSLLPFFDLNLYSIYPVSINQIICQTAVILVTALTGSDSS